MSNLRRSMMMAGRGSGEDPYAGWVRGNITDDADVVNENESSVYLCSPLFTYSHQLEVRTSFTDGDCRIRAYKNNTRQAAATTKFIGQKLRNVPHYSGYDLIRIEVTASEIDGCYIKDTTTNEYIWKGKNVT